MHDKTIHKTIHLKVSLVPGLAWGMESTAPRQAATIPTRAKNIMALAKLVARRDFPGYAVTGELTEEYTETLVYGSPAEIVAQINHALIGHEGKDPIYSENFDAESYLETLSASKAS